MELRKTSVVWNYKYADVEFGRLQARDLLQHLWTGPISNAPVDIVQVSQSRDWGVGCCRAHPSYKGSLEGGIPRYMLLSPGLRTAALSPADPVKLLITQVS